MSTLSLIILASIAEAIVSFLASIAVIINESRVRRAVHWVMSFAVGAMLGAVFFDILPETFEFIQAEDALVYVFFGFLLFFILEKALLWYHCHDGECQTHAAGYLVSVGDAVHNFIDGIIIALAFLVDTRIGIISIVAVILHEIPQEVSDFTIMLHSGFSKTKALMLNVFVSLATILGALVGYYVGSLDGLIGIMLALVAGNFLYIAAADLIPELHHRHGTRSSVMQVGLIIAGVFLIIGVGEFVGH